VLDERMGEEIKITVIATGFRDSQPARRERMLSGAMLPAIHHEQAAPAPARAVVATPTPRPASVPFASEVKAAAATPVVPVIPVAAPPVTIAASPVTIVAPEPELAPAAVVRAYEPAAVPLAASVPAAAPVISPPISSFPAAPMAGGGAPAAQPTPEQPQAQGAFFREPVPGSSRHSAPKLLFDSLPQRGGETAAPPRVAAPGSYIPSATAVPQPELVPVPASVFDDDFFRNSNEELRAHPDKIQPPEPAWPEARIPTFAGYAPEVETSADDELDIPAYLRQNR
jgi:cell division protein FtsZ